MQILLSIHGAQLSCTLNYSDIRHMESHVDINIKLYTEIQLSSVKFAQAHPN